ncbi:MAG: aldo/keto reductase [Tumebacillaceae bacterium]
MTTPTLPTVSIGPDSLEVSALALGCMGLAGTWNPSEFTTEHMNRGLQALEAAVQAGITFYDHADIYGRTLSETVFGEFIKNNPRLRDQLVITTKCGIIFEDEAGPYRYNLSADHIERSVRGSLQRLAIDSLDLYQIHRPDPLTHPRETAGALNRLVRDGLIRHVGVSNHLPAHVQALQAYLDVPIVTTQPSISLWNLETLHNGVLDQCLEQNIRPLAYSPLGGGVLTMKNPERHADDPRIATLRAAFETLGAKYQATPGQLSLAWLMHHPAQIVPLIGSNDPRNIQEAADACRIRLSREDWYVLWTAARGVALP